MTTINLPIGSPDTEESPTRRQPVELDLERAEAETIVAMALDRFGPRLCMATSFGDTVLVDVVTAVDRDIPVFFCDTGFHFAETLATMKAAQVRYRLDLRVVRPTAQAADVWADGPDACCRARKVDGLFTTMADHGFEAWISGLRRADSPGRSTIPIIGPDPRGFTKINPLAPWSDDDVARRVIERNLIVNPLTERGYPSIGCWPCTAPVDVIAHDGGGDPRAGRWRSSTKTECGLHLAPAGIAATGSTDAGPRITEVSL